MKYYLVLNPGSHAGRSRKMFKRLFTLLTEYQLQYEYAITQNLEDAIQLSRKANKKGYDAVVAVGGDGTINAVINGFYDQQGRRISNAQFGVIYTGTSPDFCKSYKIPIKLQQAVARLAEGRSRQIPIGKIQLATGKMMPNTISSANTTVRYFACCANIGLGAALARRANKGIRKILGDFAGTFLSLIITLVKFSSNVSVRKVDGDPEKVEKMVNTSVGLTRYIASGIQVPENGMRNTDEFYCMTVKELKFWHVFPLFRKVYSGKPYDNTNYLTLSSCAKIEFSENIENPEVEFDGDPAGFLPCSIELAADMLEVIS